MDGLSIGSNSKIIVACQLEESLIQPELNQVFQPVTIGSLPDNVLLDIFDFYQVDINESSTDERSWNWEKLVHVCQRWRYIIFESPIRLNLQLFCTEKSPVRKLSDVWPPFPLVIRFRYDNSYLLWQEPGDQFVDDSIVTDNLIGALEHRDRVREIQLHIVRPPDRHCDRIVTAMEESFPVLVSLSFKAGDEGVLLNTLLNGSAPCLRRLTLSRISYPSLPQLLSSTSNLTWLKLVNISGSGYIPPETMATSLSALPRLEILTITFESPAHHPERRNRAPPQTRLVLPALTSIEFDGMNEYLEVLTARFDAPQLDEFTITFFYQGIFDIPQTVRFLAHLDLFKSSNLTLEINLLWWSASISFTSNTTHHFASPSHSWHINCCNGAGLDRKLISVRQICNQILPFLSSVKALNIKFGQTLPVIPTLWLEIFHSLPSVQRLQIPDALKPYILSVLEGPTEESLAAAEVFPLLDSLSIVGIKPGEPVKQPIQSSFRRRSGRTVAVLRTFSS